MQTELLDRPALASALPAGALALGLSLLVLLAWDLSHLDLWAVRLAGDAHGFALRDAWVTRVLIHEGGRLLSYLAMGILVLINLVPGLMPALGLRERRWWLATTLACLAVISLIKRFSLTSCPWDLAEFGGVAHYVSHWVMGAHDGGGGRCFPSGHASAAFAYLSGGWALARAYPRAARAWVLACVGLGVIYGLGQMLRGAHYPSHTMWTAWICWAVTMAAAQARPWRLRRVVAA
jgi:membrane-associated PAP2 superfamily phosphatase